MDIGANVGQTLVDFCSSGRRSGYIGFEPNPVCVQHLQKIVEKNGLDFSVIPTGLADENKIATLYLTAGRTVDGSATMMEDLRPSRQGLQTEHIACHRLDDIYPDVVKRETVAFGKIDVEGGELFVLRGMRALLTKHRPWLLCEVLGRDAIAEAAPYLARNREMGEILKGAGYNILRVEKSDHGKQTIGLTPIAAFPDVCWTEENKEEFDYLFVPANQVDEAARLLANDR